MTHLEQLEAKLVALRDHYNVQRSTWRETNTQLYAAEEKAEECKQRSEGMEFALRIGDATAEDVLNVFRESAKWEAEVAALSADLAIAEELVGKARADLVRASTSLIEEIKELVRKERK